MGYHIDPASLYEARSASGISRQELVHQASFVALLGPSSTIEAARAGDRQARARVMAAIDPLIRKLTARYRPEALEFDDALQEARLAVLVHLPRYRDALPFTTWVCLTVRETFALWIRYQTRQKRSPAGGFPGSVELDTLSDDDPLIPRALLRNPYPQALNRAFVAECRERIVPDTKKAAALEVYLSDGDLKHESLARGLDKGALWHHLHAWIRLVRRELNVGPKARGEEVAP